MKISYSKTSFIHLVITATMMFFAFLPANIVLPWGLDKYLRLAGEFGCLAWGILFFKDIDIPSDFFLVLLCVFQFAFIFSAMIHSTNYRPFTRIAIQILSICVLIRGMSKTDPKALLTAMICVFELYALIHLVFRIPNHPMSVIDETGELYFLGSDNEATSPFLLLFISSILYTGLFGASLLSVAGVVLPVFTAVYSRCGTAIMVYAVVFAGAVLYRFPVFKRIIRKFANARGMLILIILYYLIVWGITLSKLTFIGQVINQLTGKDAITFTNRDEIWIEAFRIIRKNLMFGIGYGGGANGNGIYVRDFWFGAHNLLLQWGVNGGIVALGLFFLVLFAVLKKMESYGIDLRVYLCLGLLGYLIAMSMENYSNGLHLLPILTLLFCYSSVQDRRWGLLNSMYRISVGKASNH